MINKKENGGVSTANSVNPSSVGSIIHSLPCIKNEDDFRRELKVIFSDFNPYFSYYLEFVLYMDSTDENTKLMVNWGGYHIVYSYKYDIETALDLDGEVKYIYDMLWELLGSSDRDNAVDFADCTKIKIECYLIVDNSNNNNII